MKYIPAKILILVLMFTGILIPSYAQSPTTVEKNSVEEEVQDLKDKVAEKVEELKSQKRQAISGIIQEISDGSLVLLNAQKEKVVAEIDDTLTSYYEVVGKSVKEQKIEDFETGDYVFVTGPEIGERVTANAVYKDSQNMVLSGKIIEVSSEDFTVKIVSVDKSEYTLDIQKSTTQTLLDIKSLKTSKIGFSKLKEGDSVHAVVKGTASKEDSSRFDAVKLLVIPNEYFLQ